MSSAKFDLIVVPKIQNMNNFGVFVLFLRSFKDKKGRSRRSCIVNQRNMSYLMKNFIRKSLFAKITGEFFPKI